MLWMKAERVRSVMQKNLQKGEHELKKNPF